MAIRTKIMVDVQTLGINFYDFFGKKRLQKYDNDCIDRLYRSNSIRFLTLDKKIYFPILLDIFPLLEKNYYFFREYFHSNGKIFLISLGIWKFT